MRPSPKQRFLLLGLFGAIAGLITACQTRLDDAPAAVTQQPTSHAGSVIPTAATTAPSILVPAAPVRPDLRSEPTINVLLAATSGMSITVLAPLTHAGQRIDAGTYAVQPSGDGLVLGGIALASGEVLSGATPGPKFRATLTPPFGPAQTLDFTGDLVLRREGAKIQLIERTGLETYLTGVVGTEMNPNWPAEALKAQAVAARSYAAYRVWERFDKPWQLHWHFSVDMAYAGARSSASVRAAVEGTRGQFLLYREHPLPALFHACSGGQTEAAGNFLERMVTRDGTPMAAQMPVVPDAAAEAGCQGLKLAASHWRWKENIPGRKVLEGLRDWQQEHPEDKLKLGSVLTNVKVLSRHPDSGRAALIEITSKEGKKTLVQTMRAGDFRMAVGPGDMRSTWLDRCLLVAGKGGTLVLTGRGFGHGVGLSQVSAWQLARSGEMAPAILRRFYPTADLVDRY